MNSKIITPSSEESDEDDFEKQFRSILIHEPRTKLQEKVDEFNFPTYLRQSILNEVQVRIFSRVVFSIAFFLLLIVQNVFVGICTWKLINPQWITLFSNKLIPVEISKTYITTIQALTGVVISATLIETYFIMKKLADYLFKDSSIDQSILEACKEQN